MTSGVFQGCTIKDGRLMFDRLISESVVEPLNPHSKAGSQKVYKLNWGQKTRNLVAQSFDKDLGKSIKVLDVRQTSKGQPDELQGSRKRSLAPSAVSIDHHGSGSGGKRANKEA
ncbi:hypothetical protein EV182_001361 [Spiromyces aspiralis]|uniref:Uncharacterized protein n=1 Tax=Spiromyces aspiralis TaxID=68401 RepID=A0ACC1HFQ0_9FUNG|nr:hypothetical protein EV182_001361 [Spiromyces aspiralis]